MIMTEWPENVEQKYLKAYFSNRNEILIRKGCLVWGLRVLKPHSFQPRVFNEFHIGHIGIVKMKSLARSCIKRPDIDIRDTCYQDFRRIV